MSHVTFVVSHVTSASEPMVLFPDWIFSDSAPVKNLVAQNEDMFASLCHT